MNHPLSQKILNFTLTLVVVTGLFFPLLQLQAQTEEGPIKFRPNMSIPGSDFVAGSDIQVEEAGKPILMVRYIQAVYKFFVGIAGILAVFMIVMGGVIWLFSGGKSERITTAKETIVGAIAGLVLAVGSYSILYTINPSLVSFQLNVAPVPGFAIPAWFCEDMLGQPGQMTSANLTFKPASGDAINAQNTLCGQEYNVLSSVDGQTTDTKKTCHGRVCSGSYDACGFKFALSGDNKVTNECNNYKDACKGITDGSAEYHGFPEMQSSCDQIAIDPSKGRCLWLDKALLNGWGDGCEIYDTSEINTFCRSTITSCEDYNNNDIFFTAGRMFTTAITQAFCLDDTCSIKENRTKLQCSWSSSWYTLGGTGNCKAK